MSNREIYIITHRLLVFIENSLLIIKPIKQIVLIVKSLNNVISNWKVYKLHLIKTEIEKCTQLCDGKKF